MSRIRQFWWMPDGWRILVFDDRAAIDEHLVATLVDRVNKDEIRRVALASGASFAGFFESLRRGVDQGRIRLNGVEFHHLDEFEGVERFSQGSLSGEIRRALFPDDDARRGRLRAVDPGWGTDPVAAHEKNIAGAELALLGIGRNGHLAFNEPGTPLGSRAHVATLSGETREGHAAAFGAKAVPERALTAGIQTILSAREIVLVATGAAKARAIARALLGPLSPDCPASAIRLHDRVTILLDDAAASDLGERPRPGWVVPGLSLLERGSAELRSLRSALVVAPHPDDASISCGGFLGLLPTGERRHIATFSTGARAISGMSAEDGARLRERESEEEAAALGATVSFLRAKAYESGVVEPADVAAMTALLERVRPDAVLLPAREDPHPTHRLCRLTAEEALTAYARASRSKVEVWTYEGPWFQLARPEINALVKLDRDAHERKQRGIRAHRSQIARVPFDRGSEAMERLRAIQFAESHLGGRTDGGFDHEARLECYRRVVLTSG